MRIHYCDHHEVPLPAHHRFPMRKYALLRERLVESGVLAASELEAAPLATREDALLVHDAAYVDAFLAGELERSAQQRIGFPWSPGLVARTLASLGGTIAASERALQDGFSGNLAGGTHHAFRDAGAGFCVFNDIAVAALRLLERERASRVLVVDLDVHQGDGTAAIFAGDERVFTLSLHGARNFPGRKQRSDLDLALPDGTDDEAYLEALDVALAQAFERAAPDFVFYQAGVDPLREDRLGRLALTHEGLRERDARVFARARAAGVPLAVTLGGGYAEPIETSIEAHVGTYRAARAAFGP